METVYGVGAKSVRTAIGAERSVLVETEYKIETVSKYKQKSPRNEECGTPESTASLFTIFSTATERREMTLLLLIKC